MNRREFLAASTAAAGVLAVGAGAQAQPQPGEFEPLPIAVQYNKLPPDMTDEEKFRIAKEVGFEGVEAYPMEDLDAARRQGELAREAGVPVHSITYGGWGAPMSSPDPEVIKKGQAEIENALRTARAMECDTILLVPAVVTPEVRYEEAWINSQKNIRPMIPIAEELGVIIAVENVWNRFLLSPLEFAQYVDEFDSTWVRGYFDAGNVVIHGYPQDWIRTLGPRIHKVHVKEFKREGYSWPSLPYEGDIDWPEVRLALHEVGYTDFLTEEYPRGDVEWLAQMAQGMRQKSIGAAAP